MRRTVITGMGLVTPLGVGVETVWSRLLASRSGLRRLPDEIVGDLPAKVGGTIPRLDEDELGGLDLDRVVASKVQRRMDRFIVLALAAAEEAIAQAGWRPNTEQDRQKTATIIASGIGGFLTITDAVDTVRDRGARPLSPFTIPAFLVNPAAGRVSIKYGFKGAIGAPVTACAASVQAIGDAAHLVRTGEADVAICGVQRHTSAP